MALDFQDNVDPPYPKITGVPERIYLEIGEDADGDFDNFREVTWCRDKQFDTDIAYVLADKLASAESRLTIAVKAERERCAKVVENYKHRFTREEIAAAIRAGKEVGT